MPVQPTDPSDSDCTEDSPLLQRLEEMLYAEGLLPGAIRPMRCFFCGMVSTECDYHEGTDLEGNLCPDCAPVVGDVECFIGERGTVLQRHLRVGQQHFLFVKPGRSDGVVLMVGPKTWEELPHFDPTGRSDEELINEACTSCYRDGGVMCGESTKVTSRKYCFFSRRNY